MGLYSKDCSLEWFLNHYQQPLPMDWNETFGRKAPVDVEIGFGLGEVLTRSALAQPDRNFVGFEQDWTRLYRTLRNLTLLKQSHPSEKNALANIRLLKIDARIAFERLFCPRSVDYVYALFPCPWPKKSHIKYRLFTRDFLKLINNRLKSGGRLKIVTDFLPYFEWVRSQARGTGFQLQTTETAPQYETKFEKKWRKEGQEKFYEIILIKQRHASVAIRKVPIMESYKLKEFSPEKFIFNDLKGKTAIVLKEKNFDSQQKSLLLHLVVAEQTITQHFWARIFYKENYWRICKVDGQQICPTPGIAKALKMVYEAAQKTTHAK